MLKKKWIYAGCGGCLGVTVLFIIGLLILIWMARNFFTKIDSQMIALNEEYKQLAEDFPFTRPNEFQIDEARFSQFLAIREKTIAAVQSKEELAWFLQMAESKEKRDELSIFGLISHSYTGAQQVIDAGFEQVSFLREAEMAMEEYVYLTKIITAEILSWYEQEEDTARADQAKAYFQWFFDLNQWREERVQRDPDDTMDPVPFDFEEFKKDLTDYRDPEHTNRSLISAQAAQVFISKVAVAIDAFVVNMRPPELEETDAQKNEEPVENE